MDEPKHKSALFIISTWISVLGHPLLTVAVFIIAITFYLFDNSKAFFISAIIIGLGIIPITIWNYYKTKKGEYSNFDVSVKKQRSSMYLLIMGLLSIITIVFFITEQPPSICYGMMFALILFIISFIINFLIKVSLHTALSLFLALSIMTIHLKLGIAMVGFSIAIAGSRLILKRHTFSEIVVGTIIGTLTGGILYYIIMWEI